MITSLRAKGAPTARGDARLLAVLRAEVARYVRALHAARGGRQRDVHALRIATRRMLALMAFAAVRAPSGKWRALVREMRRPFRKCARLRDLQATRAQLRLMRSDDPALRALLRAMLASLREDIRRHRRRTIAQLGQARPRRTGRRIIRLAAARLGKARPTGSVRGCIDRNRLEVRAACRRMRRGGIKALHRARVAIKRCRYALEMAAMLGADASPAELRALRRLQQELGAITDLELLRRECKRFARSHRGQGRALAQLRRQIGSASERRRRRALAMAGRDVIVVARA